MGMTDEEATLHDLLSDLKQHLRSSEPAKIVLIGDVMMDCYIHGYANNLNSRAPVPVLRETSREDDVGAAAHVARGLRSMGLDSHLFGVVGDDAAGMNIIEALEAEGVRTRGIAVIEDRTTTVKTRMLASRESLIREEQLLLRWDIEDDAPVPEKASEILYDQAAADLVGASALIASDYGQGVITDQGADALFKAAKKEGIPVIADPKLTGVHRTEGVDWILFQSQGLELMRRRLAATTGAEAAAKLIQQYNWKHLVVLSGEAGVTIYSAEEETVHAPCGLVDLRQMIGLIDAAAVAIAFSLSRGLDVRSTALIANAACECILAAEQTDSFVLSRDDLIHRVGEHVWNLQVSKR
jgi:D-beta-D-heptose 7-phosphate kinase/D-beta-D-heptose 1-phosphate adenosyltransferase